MKKAKLDILEELPEIDLAEPEAEIAAEEAAAEIPEKQSGGAWAFNKLLLIGAPAVFLALLICGALIYYLFFGEAPKHPKKAPVVVTKPDTGKTGVVDEAKDDEAAYSRYDWPLQTARIPLNAAYVKDFMIDLTDSRGKSRVLLCDFAFDLGPDQAREKFENNIDVRNTIYKTAQRHSVAALKSLEERKKLKQELVSELDRLLGKGSVKDVYFVNYFIM